MTNREPVLGVDIGNVIIGSRERTPVRGKDKYADSAFLNGDRDTAIATPANPGSFAAIRELLPLFGGRVWLVSKCGPRIQVRTLDWLDHHRFWVYTSLTPDHLRFCILRNRKRAICAELGITHFVDDRPDIITSLTDVVEHRYLFGPQEQEVFATGNADGLRLGPSLHLAPNWSIARQLIRRTFIHEVARLKTAR